MRYLSVCSGIEAASVAWHPLGWEPVAFSDIEKFPSAVLAHHYPGVPNWGDMTKFKEWPDATIDLLVGGTPCQSFSVAGLRKGLADPRGNLALTYLAIADKYRPEWLVWENVPGVLSADKGEAFGAFLGGLGELGYGWAYRVLDAQYFGLAQRRKRVFVVGCLGGWQRAAAVLFDSASLRGDSAPRREAGQKPAPTLGAGPVSGGRKYGTDADSADSLIVNALTERPDRGGGNSEGQRLIPMVAPTLDQRSGRSGQNSFATSGGLVPETVGALCDGAHMGGGLNGQDAYSGRIFPVIGGSFDVAHSLRADGFDASEDGTGRGTPLIAQTLTSGGTGERGYLDPVNQTLVAFSAKDHGADAGDIAPTLRSGGHDKSHANGGVMPAVAFDWQSGGDCRGLDPKDTAQLQRCQVPATQQGMQVRRLTPRECERLQGFPDDYTLIPYRGKPAADGPRYKALGNSFAVPVVRWIGQRIEQVDAIDG